MQLEEEGCLSVPGFNATVVRPARAVVKALDRTGTEFQHRRHGPAGPRVPARDGSPRRHAVRRSPARHQARPHRSQDPEADARRQMVTAPGCASRSSARRASPCRRSMRSSPRDHAVVGVVTQPDRPRGRGQKLTDAPVKARAVAAGVPVLQPERLRDRGLRRVVRLLARRPRRRRRLRQDPRRRAARHAAPRHDQRPRLAAAPLPRRRTRPPRRHRRRDARPASRSCASCKALDAGPMLATVATTDRTRRNERRGRARSRAARRGSARSKSLDRDGSRAGRRRRRRTTPGHLRASAHEGRRRHRLDALQPSASTTMVRGLHPWPHAYTFHDGRRLIVRRTSTSAGPSGIGRAAAPGTIVSAAEDDLVVANGRRDCFASSRFKPKASGRWLSANFSRVIASCRAPHSQPDDRAGAQRRVRHPLRDFRRPRRSAGGHRTARDALDRRTRSRARGRNRHRRTALAWRARSPHRPLRQTADRTARSPRSSRSCASARISCCI